MTETKFTFGQRVRITKGFYRGRVGTVKLAERVGWPWARVWEYSISCDDLWGFLGAPESELEAVPEEGSEG